MEENKKAASKTYRVRIPMYMSEQLEKKLKEENEKYSNIARKAVENYLKKSKKNQ